MNTRLPLILAVLLLVVASAVVVFFVTRPGALVPPTEEPIATSTDSATVTDVQQYYDIQASYPAQVALDASASASAQATANAIISGWVVETIATFKKNANLDNLTPEDIAIQRLDDGRKYTLDIKYETHSNGTTISYLFPVFEDTLGAHPNAYYRSFTFNVASGSEVRIADLFEGQTYATTLSKISRAMLIPKIATATNVPEAKLDTTYLESGTTADATNFEMFYLTDTDLVIIFPPYQVGPWVLGTQTIFIPRSELASELKAEYR